MKEKIVDRLVSIKSIVTLMVTVVFAYLCVTGVIPGGDFMTVFLIIIGFYFGMQHEKKIERESEAEE